MHSGAAKRRNGPRQSYVIYGGVPWDTPWLNDQNIAQALARTADVLYVEPPISPLTPFREGPDRPLWARMQPLIHRGIRRSHGVGVIRPLALPPLKNATARAASLPGIRSQIRSAVRTMGLRAPVTIAFNPGAAALAGTADERLRVYFLSDWLEAGASMLGRNSEDLASECAAMWDVADLICVVSTQLQQTLMSSGIASVLVPHGFHTDLAELYDAPPPSEYADLERPLIGYAGRIDGRLDFAALTELADRFSEGSLVLIGPLSSRVKGRDAEDLRKLRSRPNVHFIPTKTRAELPPYLAHLDCSLLPYRPGNWANHGAPMKLWDYLYAGAPIVASGYISLTGYPPPLVHFVERREDFGPTVATVIAGGDRGRERRRALAAASSWDVRAAELREQIEAALERKERAAAAPAALNGSAPRTRRLAGLPARK
jgi:teichuronic acid biosynthesis glycosyltransferase TuaH